MSIYASYTPPLPLPSPLPPATATTNITNMKVNLNNGLLIEPEKFHKTQTLHFVVTNPTCRPVEISRCLSTMAS